MNITTAQLRKLGYEVGRKGVAVLARRSDVGGAGATMRPAKRRGVMNRWELRYAKHLDLLVAAKEIGAWAFELIRVRLADGAYYTPDFAIFDADGRLIRFVEVKGFKREAAMLRVKLCREVCPVPLVVVKKVGDSWEEI